MASQSLTSLTATTTPTSTDIAYVVDGGESRQATLGNFSKGIVVTNLDVTGLTVSQLLRVNSGGTAIESSGKTVPTGDIVGTSDTQTLTNKTLTTPTIGDFTNATHDHSNNAGGGSIVSASTTVAGRIEIATATETTTGTDATRAVSPDGLAGSDYGKRVFGIEVFAPTTDCATGDGKKYFRIPSILNGYNLVAVAAQVVTAGTTGTMDIQIHNVTDAADMLSTVITIDTTEIDSSTAAAPAVIDAAADDVATADQLRIDIDAVHTTAAKGLVCELTFQLP